jgi:hypothetical protein
MAKKKVTAGNLPGVSSRSILYICDATSGGSNYRIRNMASGSATSISWEMPAELKVLTKAELLFWPAAGAATTGQNIDLETSFASVGESITIHQTSDTSTLYDLTGKTSVWCSIDFTTLMSAAVAGDICGVKVTLTATGGNLNVLGVRVTYSTVAA